LLQKLEAFGMHYAGVAVCSKLICAPVNDKSLFKPRQQNESTYRRLGRSDQKPVVSACIAPVDCARGKPANSVGLQPFAAQPGIEVAANLFAEAGS
jgi:hypothetical protein